MKRIAIILLICIMPWCAQAASGVAMTLEHVHINLNNTAAIQRGADFFCKKLYGVSYHAISNGQ